MCPGSCHHSRREAEEGIGTGDAIKTEVCSNLINVLYKQPQTCTEQCSNAASPLPANRQCDLSHDSNMANQIGSKWAHERLDGKRLLAGMMLV